MGVVNATPNSFSDGGRFVDVDAAVAHGEALWRAGADVLDIGGEATNPAAAAVTDTIEIARVVPVIRRLRASTTARLSIDTTKASVAAAALAEGVDIVNDISGGAFDPNLWSVVAQSEAIYVLGHVRGQALHEIFDNEATRRPSPHEVISELSQRVAQLPTQLRARTWVDPGLGFGKGADLNLNAALIAHTPALSAATGCRVVIGHSRKRFLRDLASPPSRAMQATTGACAGESDRHPLDELTAIVACAAMTNGAHVIRVHDVNGTVTALRAFACVMNAQPTHPGNVGPECPTALRVKSH